MPSTWFVDVRAISISLLLKTNAEVNGVLALMQSDGKFKHIVLAILLIKLFTYVSLRC